MKLQTFEYVESGPHTMTLNECGNNNKSKKIRNDISLNVSAEPFIPK